MLSPAFRDGVAAATNPSTFLHLWREMFERSAYDKNVCPPAGSFLHEIFQRIETLHRFKRVYEPNEFEALLAAWRPVKNPPEQAAQPI